MSTYKIVNGSKLFDQLQALQKKCKQCKEEANKLAIEFGGIKVATTGRYLAGGIDGIEFKNDNIPDKTKWRTVGKKWQDLYYPKSSNKEALSKIASLPTVDVGEIQKIFNHKTQLIVNSEGFCMVSAPQTHFYKNVILVNYPMAYKCEPVDGMIEILNSEFNSIKDKEDAKINKSAS